MKQGRSFCEAQVAVRELRPTRIGKKLLKMKGMSTSSVESGLQISS